MTSPKPAGPLPRNPVIPPRNRRPQRPSRDQPVEPAADLDPFEDDDWPVDRGRPLGLRLLALLGALSFVMLGLSSLAPLLQPQPANPPTMPDQRDDAVS
jgi:hypothetical protein